MKNVNSWDSNSTQPIMTKVIVDTNVIATVFNPSSHDYFNFQPVYNCITSPKCNGVLIYGGSKFKKELKTLFLRKRIFKILRDAGRLHELDQDQVDCLCRKFKKMVTCKHFNDEHLIACIFLSGSKIIVTDDRRADKYIKDNDRIFYNKPGDRPKIYRYRDRHYKIFLNCCKN